ncbi:hypothetical protein C0J52_12004 [Blattella germanica]|nr:hypothetical protein C0J52_12004 [Blattella germanica]
MQQESQADFPEENRLTSNNHHIEERDASFKDMNSSESDSDNNQDDSLQSLDMYENQEDEDETRCGFREFQPEWLQKLASKKTFFVVYGLTGIMYSFNSSYFNAIISTLEKRFKFQSGVTGLLVSSIDLGVLIASLWVAYLGSSGNKPRWLASGTLVVGLTCFMRLLPHLIYGPGKDALELTIEYAATQTNSSVFKEDPRTSLCMAEILDDENHCSAESSSIVTIGIFLASFLIMGAACSIYYTLGITYLDDNVHKEKTALFLASWQCVQLMGPTIGYYFASFSLRQYVDTSLHPTITNEDPRWIGAWWLGWGPLGVFSIFCAILLSLFPKKLPRAAERMRAAVKSKKKESKSFSDFMQVMSRLTKNKVFVLNVFSVVFYMFGLIGYWIFLPKYIETQFRQTASNASFVTGSVGLIFTALGFIAAGIVITKYKPRARYLAAWNVFGEACEVIGNFSFIFITCPMDDLQGSMTLDHSWNMTTACNIDCDCGPNIPYSPICSLTEKKTFYSPCHAGCQELNIINTTKVYENCSCIYSDGKAVDGPCPVDCSTTLIIYILQETRCGLGSWQPEWLQKFASKKTFVLVYGLIGMIDTSIQAYNGATISTIEKRFKIPSRTSGIIASAWDTGVLSTVMVLAYLGTSRHRTRWVAAGTFVIGLANFMRILPHLIYGPGMDALKLTKEYEELYGEAQHIANTTVKESSGFLCQTHYHSEEDCTAEEGSEFSIPVLIFYTSFFITGVANSIYNTLGITYMDDNARKDKAPILLGNIMKKKPPGPARTVRTPEKIDRVRGTLIRSPRRSARWCFIGFIDIILAALMLLFPKKLPRAMERSNTAKAVGKKFERKVKKSFSDLKEVLTRLLKNKLLVLNTLSVVLFLFGQIGYYTFLPKYVETMFRQTASTASFVTGTIGLIFTAMGILASGIVISKFKPRARYLAGWNVLVEALEVAAHCLYGFLTCPVNDFQGTMKPDLSWDLTSDCNVNCDCGPDMDYSPICSSDGTKSFFTPCHAGCTDMEFINGTKRYSGCTCIEPDGWAMEGICPVDCGTKFAIFLVIKCIMSFLCVSEEDKPVSIGFAEILHQWCCVVHYWMLEFGTMPKTFRFMMNQQRRKKKVQMKI